VPAERAEGGAARRAAIAATRGMTGAPRCGQRSGERLSARFRPLLSSASARRGRTDGR
jgi:hypothetical protein